RGRAEPTADGNVRGGLDRRAPPPPPRPCTAGGARSAESAREEILIRRYGDSAQRPAAADRDPGSPQRHGRDEPAVDGDADAVEAGAQVARARRHPHAHRHEPSLTSARTSATRGAMTGAARNTGATASTVFRPFPVMHSTTSSSAENRPSPASASAAATVTPPAVSVKIPTASASSRIPATSSVSRSEE